jgi:hypothetical protein
MRIEGLRKILREFVNESRSGKIGGVSPSLIAAAEQLEQGLNKGISESVIKGQTISFAPGGCPCCGK